MGASRIGARVMSEEIEACSQHTLAHSACIHSCNERMLNGNSKCSQVFGTWDRIFGRRPRTLRRTRRERTGRYAGMLPHVKVRDLFSHLKKKWQHSRVGVLGVWRSHHNVRLRSYREVSSQLASLGRDRCHRGILRIGWRG